MSIKVRGVREAANLGWTVISTRNLKVPASWNQLHSWLDSNCKGKYTESFYLQAVAFEHQRDASWFTLRWS